MKLVDDAHKAWTWFSTWLLAMNGTFIVAYENFAPVKEYVPEKWAHAIMGGLLILTFLGRIVKQGETDAQASSNTSTPKS